MQNKWASMLADVRRLVKIDKPFQKQKTLQYILRCQRILLLATLRHVYNNSPKSNSIPSHSAHHKHI